MNGLGSWLLGRLATVLPPLLLRWIFPPEKIAREIRIALQGESPIQPTLDGEFPHIDLWLEITNLSHLHLVLDRMLLNLWFGQPTLEGSILYRTPVPSRKTCKDVHFWTDLTTAQVKRIKSFIDNPSSGGRIYLTMTAYFESRVGHVQVEQRFERSKL